ncbi:MAG: hypothetical protein Q7J64_06395 [Elusimicrobiota bacterium]|nr:hypothetical protein [Elusimicrobiota bacterium]
MTMLTTAVIAALAAQTAFAEQRANKPFNTANGRTTAAPAPAPRVITVNSPGGGAAANVGPAMISAVSNGGGQAFTGGGRRSVSRVSGGSRRGGKAFWGGRKVDGDAPAPSTEEAPPHFSKPGALIRTTGQAPVYAKAEDARTHTVDAGSIVLSKHKIFDVGKAPSVQVGPKDTLPPPNPVSGGNYGTGATANSGPSSGSGSGSGNGKNNNGSGNNDKNKPGDDFDDHGGVSSDLVGDSINAAF